MYAQSPVITPKIDSTSVDSAEVGKQLEGIGPELIVVWKPFVAENYQEIINDSLLRWQIWPNWGDMYAYRRDVISFRQGTVGRIDAFQISGYSPYEQSLDLEGINLSSPITGLVNYNYVPHHKIGVVHERKSGSFQSDVELKKYHILEPISYLNYDEAKFNYRNLEFMVAQNFTERTNVELSFWDRRDGDNYPRNDVLGNQILARAYHYLNQNIQLRSIYLRNQFELEEPFGYVVSNPGTFSFDEFSSASNVSNGASDNFRRDFITGIYARKDSLSQEHMGLEVTLGKNEINLTSSSDTLNWDLRTQGISAFKVVGSDQLSLKVEGGGIFNSFKTNRNISKSSWSIFSLKSELNMAFSSDLSFSGFGHISQRSDGFTDTEIGGGTEFSISRSIKINTNASLFSRMPTIQELYWVGDDYLGNSNLKNETGISIFGAFGAELGNGFTIGLSTRFKQSKNETFILGDSTFTNSGDVSSVSGTVFSSFQNHRFEIESSATLDALNEINPEGSSTPISYNEQKLWIRNNIFIKGYAFDRAAFIKLGVRTTLSPLAYGSKYFNTGLQYWQPNSNEIDLPAFFRLDVELSARVRSIMVLMRWENALDGVGQLGYFEAATLPMPARRLIVGIRAQFRN